MSDFEQILFESIGKKIVSYEISFNYNDQQCGFVLRFDDDSKMDVHSSGSEEGTYVTLDT